MSIRHFVVGIILTGSLSWGQVWAQVSTDLRLQRVEPTNWWTDMAHQDLQLLVYGEGIANANVSVQYPGVTLNGVQRVENENYLFLDLTISEDARAGTVNLTFGFPAPTVPAEEGLPVLPREVTFPYQLKDRKAGSAQREGFNTSDVLLLLTIDRFANGDESNDNVEGYPDTLNRAYKGGRHGGDIQGLINHLDYLDDMGFTQIWPMPVLENNQPGYSYHGYSTTDYYKVDPRYGSNEDYVRLSDEAAARGMGLVMDMILNHCGSEHWWMKDLPSEDWINHGGEFSPTNHRREALHDIHAAETDKAGFVDGWFVPTMPDLNQRNPLMANYLIQNAIWWVETANLSGIRVDTYSYSDKDFLSEWTRRLMEEYPRLNIVGEEWSVNPVITSYWQHGSYRRDGYESYLPSVMDFPLQAAVVDGLKDSESWASGLRNIYEVIATDFIYGDPYNLVIFPDNHDMSRIHSQLNDDVELTKIALSFFMTMRGIPQLFYGTEILMNNPGTDDHGIIRSDFPGGWPDDIANGFTGQGLSAEQADMQLFTKRLLNWRKTSDAVINGNLMQYGPEDSTYTYFRYSDSDRVMVIINKDDSAKTLDMTRFEEGLAGATKGANALTGQPYSLEGALTVGPKQALIIQVLP